MSGEWLYVCHCNMSLKKKTTVLLVDDHLGFLDEVSGLLTDEYKIVGTARDGRTALDAARKSHAEIILLDIEMPMLNGIEVARAIRQAGLTSKVVFLTMHADPIMSLLPLKREHKDIFSSLIFIAISSSRWKQCWQTESLSRDMLPEKTYAGT